MLAKGCEHVIAYSRSRHDVPEGVTLCNEDEVLSADYLFFTVAISSFEEVLKRVGKNLFC